MSPGAVAGPLTGVRAPQRVSAPPSSGLATVPFWPSPAKKVLGSVFFSLAGERPVRLPFPFFPVPFSPLGLTRGGVGVKI